MESAQTAGARRQGPPRAAARFVLVALAAAAVVAATYLVTVGSHAGQLLGELILGGASPTFDEVVAAESVLRNVSISSLAIGTVAAVAVALLQRRPRLAVAAVAAIVGANVTTQLLKEVVLDRADLLGGLFYFLPNSFPSGHATAAASIAVALLLGVPPLLRAPTILVSAVAVAVFGVSTLVAGWHRMADAIGAAFVAAGWGAGLAAVLALWRGVELVGPRVARLGQVGAGVPVVIGAGMVVIGGLAYGIAALDPFGVLPQLAEQGGSPALFAVGVIVVAGASFLALGALGLAMRDVRLDPRPRRDERRASPPPPAPPSGGRSRPTGDS